MGMDEIAHSKRDAKAKKRDERKEQFKPRGASSGGVADWGGVSGEVLAHTIATVAAHGGALRFGYTRDGGAYALGVYGDGQPHTVYIKPGDDVEAVLGELAEWFGEGGAG